MKSLKRDKNDSPGKSFTDNCGRLIESPTISIQLQFEQATSNGTCASQQVVIHLLDGSTRSGPGSPGQQQKQQQVRMQDSSMPVDAKQSRTVSGVCSVDDLCQHMAQFFTAAPSQDLGEHKSTDCSGGVTADECLDGAVSSTSGYQPQSHQEAGSEGREKTHWTAIRCQDACSGSYSAPDKATDCQGGAVQVDAVQVDASRARNSGTHYGPDMDITGQFLKLTVATCGELQSSLVSYEVDPTLL